MGVNESTVRDIEVYSCPRCAGRPEVEPLRTIWSANSTALEDGEYPVRAVWSSGIALNIWTVAFM